MNQASNNTTIFSRQPLAISGKISVIALICGALLSGWLALLIGLPDNMPLLITTVVQLVVAGIIALGLRWTPLLGTLVGGVFLAVMTTQPDVIYHMTHPKEGNFLSFVIDILLFATFLIVCVVTLTTTIQNYRNGERRLPGWLPSLFSVVGGIVIGAILIAAIAPPAMTSGAASASGEAVVHMGPGTFLQSSVAVHKGTKLQIIDDGSFVHILANGFWQNGQAKLLQEAGAPAVNNVQVKGNSVEIGPFTAAGTYHIYCTVHPGMNLTVNVS